MKLTWNKNPKKRSRVALSNFSDLPFEKEEEAEDDFERRQNTDQLDSSEFEGNHSGNYGNVDLEVKNLAESFRAQGDKLAEVINQLYNLRNLDTCLRLASPIL